MPWVRVLWLHFWNTSIYTLIPYHTTGHNLSLVIRGPVLSTVTFGVWKRAWVSLGVAIRTWVPMGGHQSANFCFHTCGLSMIYGTIPCMYGQKVQAKQFCQSHHVNFTFKITWNNCDVVQYPSGSKLPTTHFPHLCCTSNNIQDV